MLHDGFLRFTSEVTTADLSLARIPVYPLHISSTVKSKMFGEKSNAEYLFNKEKYSEILMKDREAKN